MHRRSQFALVAAGALFALGVLNEIAIAAPQDAAAQKLDKDAMDNDFLNANFDVAAKKLGQAVTACGDKGCAPKIKAQILIHLGIVQVNLKKDADAEKSFIDALKMEASVAPESDFASPEVEKAFQAAKKKAPSAAAPAPTPSASASSETPGAAPTEGSEVSHTRVVEQMVDTPVPIFVSIPEEVAVGKVMVMFKPFGSTEWQKLELKKLSSKGYAGLIPCEQVSTSGPLKYYIKAYDSGGDMIAEFGKASKPLVCNIKNQLDGEPPRLPKQPPPARCASRGDCPPDFPGCARPKEHGDKGWGAPCERSGECAEGLVCKDGTCEEGKEEGDGASTSPFKKNWVSLTFVPDFAFVSGDGVCSARGGGGFTCFRDKDNKQYRGTPANLGNTIQGGVAASTVRILAGYDRAFTPNITIGARAGMAFRGGPKPEGGASFLPLHLELRASYWFGKNALAKKGFRPYVFAGGGVAQVDTKVGVVVTEQPGCPVDPNYPDYCAYFDKNGNPVQWNPPPGTKQNLTAWHKAGQGFIAFGGGFVYALKANHGIVADLKISEMLPSTGTVISPEIGYTVGF